MPCNCTSTECIKVYVSPCDTGIDIGLTAPTDGDYLMFIEFNGTYQRLTITLETGEDIILPNVLNGDYTHELQIFEPDGTLLNNTCYAIHVSAVTGDGNGLTPSPAASTWKIVTVAANGNTITDSFLLTNTISEITTQGQSYLVGVDFTQTGGTITGINGLTFFAGQIVKLEV